MGEEDKSAGLAAVHPGDDQRVCLQGSQASVLPSPGTCPGLAAQGHSVTCSHGAGQGTHVHAAQPGGQQLASS